MRITLLDPASPTWRGEIDTLYRLLPENEARFPYHFVQVVLPHIGGTAIRVGDDRREAGVGFLLPRGIQRGDGSAKVRRVYTLRYHRVSTGADFASHELAAGAEGLLGDAAVIYYDPAQEQDYYATYRDFGSVNIGRPNADEASAIPQLQQRIWGSAAEFLYPADIHSTAFRPGTTLVARVEGKLAGFLFGFYKFADEIKGAALPGDWADRFGGELRIESQTLGVLPEFRGLRIGNLLKREQAELAWQEGIGIVNWTADPLQAPNGALNFGLLRAVAFDFYPDYYPFRNELNRVAASRLGLTWLVGSARVRGVDAVTARSRVTDLANFTEIARVNDGYRNLNLDADAPLIAFEIPADWTALQGKNVEEAMQWRAATDRLFSHYVGRKPGMYAITGVGAAGERRYLIAERVDDALWSRIGRV